MIDDLNDKGRIVSAALKLAAERPWSQVSLSDIADAAGVSLVELRPHFSSKSDVAVAFIGLVDEAMLRTAPKRMPGESTRDALFEVIMSRFDILAPDKAGLRSIVEGMGPDPALLRATLSSMRWVLVAAGADADNMGGAIRIAGITTLYASVFRTWLNDDDPGLARTMAALDRRLRTGERNLDALDGFKSAIERIGGAFRQKTRRDREPYEPGDRTSPSDDAVQGGPGSPA